ncbi:MAG: hypothetical protein IJK02_12300 [Clostridia bacterium]|nr:hypothetical protein [Clostridia bacterium]
MDGKQLMDQVRDLIVKREFQSGMARIGKVPMHPLLIVFMDAEAKQAQGHLQETMGFVWSVYTDKISYVSYPDGMQAANGLDLHQTMRSLFVIDSNLSDFQYGTCDVVYVADTTALQDPGALLQNVNDASSQVRMYLAGHDIREFFVALLETENPCSIPLRKLCETNPGALGDIASFFIENKLDNGGMLMKENDGWAALYNILLCIIRMTQWTDIGFAARIHTVSYRELTKPYTEMSAGTVLALLEGINKAMISWNEESTKNVGLVSEVEEKLGFTNNSFLFLDRYINERAFARLPSPEQMALFPLRTPQPVDTNGCTAADFNRMTMGSFDALLRQIASGKIMDAEVIKTAYENYLKSNLPYYEILRYLDDKRGEIDAIFRDVLARVKQPVNPHQAPLTYAKEMIRRNCYTVFIQECFASAVENVVAEAKKYRDHLFQLCASTAKIPSGDKAVLNYYKNKASDLISFTDISRTAYVQNIDQWLHDYMMNFVKNNEYFGYAYEKELKMRLNNSTADVAAIVRDRINAEVRYFNASTAFYHLDVDVSGKLIFMDAMTELCADIRREIPDSKIYDTSLNNRVEVLRIYTFS